MTDVQKPVDQIDVQELAREIAVRMDPDALMDAQDVVAFLKCSSRYVTEEYVLAPGFPKAIRLTRKDGRSQPRWQRKDILDWVKAHAGGRSKKGGRPQLNPSQ